MRYIPSPRLWMVYARLVALFGAFAFVQGGLAAQTASDVLTIGTVTAPSGTGVVRVPVYILDVAGTPLGRESPKGLSIQAFVFNVVYGPRSCVDATFETAGGILEGLPLLLYSTVGVPNKNLAVIFYASDAISFTTTAPPGDKVGELVFTLSGCPAESFSLDLTAGGSATNPVIGGPSIEAETLENGSLVVVSGAILFEGSAPPLPPPTRTRTTSTTPAATGTRTPTRTSTSALTHTPVPTSPDAGPGASTATPRPTSEGTRVPVPTATPRPTCIGPCGGGVGGNGPEAEPSAIPAASSTSLALLALVLAGAGVALARRL